MKNLTYKLLSFVLLLLNTSMLWGQNQPTTVGKDFWFAFGVNNDANYQVRLVASKKTNIVMTLTVDHTKKEFSLSAGEVYTFGFSRDEVTKVNNGASGVGSNSVHIESSEDIAVFIMELKKNSTDATNVLPSLSLGQEYFHLSYRGPDYYGDGYLVIATEDNSRVFENETLVAELSKGQVYARYSSSGTDLTGIRVRSDQPIAYFVTAQGVLVPDEVPSADCLFQQMAPVSSWGKSFLVPTTKNGRDRVRIVASQNDTEIQLSGGTVVAGSTSLQAGQFVELEISTANKGCYIYANRPIGVAAYLMGGSNFPPPAEYSGDPALAWIPPLEQKVTSTVMTPFMPLSSSALRAHYALIVTPTLTKTATTMAIGTSSAQSLMGEWIDNVASGHSYLSIEMDNFQDTYAFGNPNGLTILAYGLGAAESYYYLASSAMRKLGTDFFVNEIPSSSMLNGSYCFSELTFESRVDYALHPDAGHLKWYVDDQEVVSARDQTNWTHAATGTPNLLGKHTYKLEIKDKSGRIETVLTTFTVTSLDDPQAQGQDVCAGDMPVITVKDAVHEMDYTVYTNETGNLVVGKGRGAGVDLNITCTEVVWGPVTYYLESSNTTTCKSLRIPVEIKLAAPPKATIKASRKAVSSKHRTVQFTAEGVEDEQVHWELGDGNQASLKTFEHTYTITDRASYQVTLVVENACGRDVAYYDLAVEDDSDFFIPNTFTPNGDGYNDVFMGDCPLCEKIEIFDRQGKKLYEGAAGWDGFYRGAFAGNDTYFYIVTIRRNDRQEVYNGYVVVMGRN